MGKTRWRKEGVKITNGKQTWLRGDVVKYTKAEKVIPENGLSMM